MFIVVCMNICVKEEQVVGLWYHHWCITWYELSGTVCHPYWQPVCLWADKYFKNHKFMYVV